jgi:hypothetical protein
VSADSIKVRGRESRERRCPYCHDDIEEPPLSTCLQCETRVHPECLELLRRCPTLGCPGRADAFSSRKGSTKSKPGLQERRRLDVGDLATRPIARALERTVVVSCAIGLTLFLLLFFATGRMREGVDGLLMGIGVGLVTLPVALIEFLAERRTPGSALHGVSAVLSGVLAYFVTRLVVPLSAYATHALSFDHARGVRTFEKVNRLASAPDILWGILAMAAPFAISAYGRLARWTLKRQILASSVGSGLLSLFAAGASGVAFTSTQGTAIIGVGWIVGALLPLIYRGIDHLQARFSDAGERPAKT